MCVYIYLCMCYYINNWQIIFLGREKFLMCIQSHLVGLSNVCNENNYFSQEVKESLTVLNYSDIKKEETAEEGVGGCKKVRLWTTQIAQYEYHNRSLPKCSIKFLKNLKASRFQCKLMKQLTTHQWFCCTRYQQQDLEQKAREKHKTVCF